MATPSVVSDSSPVTPRGRRRDATENRDALLAAAALVLNDDPDAPLDTIAAAAGLSRRAVYGHFATRDDLVAEMLKLGAERLSTAIGSIVHSDERVTIALIGARLWGEVDHVRAMASLAVRGPHRLEIADALSPVRELLVSTVESGIRNRRIRSDMPSTTTARLIEEAAISVLTEATRTGLSRSVGRRLVMLATLSMAGLSWADAEELILTAPELGSATSSIGVLTDAGTETDAAAAPHRHRHRHLRGRQMKITLHDVAMGRGNSALPPTTVSFESGRATLAQAETERRPTVLGLIASGRMVPDAGSVRIDGESDPGRMRASIALIDAPEVSDPAPDVTVAGVTAEELMFAGRSSTPRAVTAALRELGLDSIARSSIVDVAPAQRVRLLTELAVLRDGVEAIVLTAPDRHGGDPAEWWAIAGELADRGYAVLVIAGEASTAALTAGAAIAAAASTQDLDPDPEPVGGYAPWVTALQTPQHLPTSHDSGASAR